MDGVRVEQILQQMAQPRVSLRHDMAVFRQKAPGLVRERGPVADQSVVHPMRRLHIKLILELYRHRAAVGRVAASAMASASRSSFSWALA
jgi:hypothetical protein